MPQKLVKHTRSSYMERKNKSSQFVASHIDTKFWKGSFPRIISEHLLTIKSSLVVVHYLSMRNPRKVDFSSLGVKTLKASKPGDKSQVFSQSWENV